MHDIELFKDAVGVYEYEPGTKITKPGLYLNMPMEAYHGTPTIEPSISSSQLRTLFNKSPAHYWLGSPMNPDSEPFKDTEFTILGRAAHHLLLGEKDFKEHFVIRPALGPDGEKWNNAKNICKAWMKEQAAERLTVITMEQLEQIKGMETSLSAEPAVNDGILNGEIEASMFYQDPETGIWVKSRPDSIPNDSDAADLKCVSDVFDEGIAKGLGNNGYHQQAALTKSAIFHTLRREMENFFLVYVEQKSPHSVRIETIDPVDIVAGERENRAALHIFRRCLETNYFPGPKNVAGDGGYVSRTKYARDNALRKVERYEKELGIQP
jgi:hypothetical protein